MPQTPAQPPKVWFWYRLYCWVAAGLHLAWLGVCVWAHFSAPQLTQMALERGLPLPDFFVTLAAGLFGSSAIGFGALCLWLPTTKPSKDAWTLHLSNIILGILTIVLAPFLVPLLFKWLAKDTKDWFNSQGKGEV
jgi:hypothetical protein